MGGWLKGDASLFACLFTSVRDAMHDTECAMNKCPPCPECGSENTELRKAGSANLLEKITKHLPAPAGNLQAVGGINQLICRDCGKISLIAIR